MHAHYFFDFNKNDPFFGAKEFCFNRMDNYKMTYFFLNLNRLLAQIKLGKIIYVNKNCTIQLRN